jgi:hypothetical protein
LVKNSNAVNHLPATQPVYHTRISSKALLPGQNTCKYYNVPNSLHK